jgi:hypothetical protein
VLILLEQVQQDGGERVLVDTDRYPLRLGDW